MIATPRDTWVAGRGLWWMAPVALAIGAVALLGARTGSAAFMTAMLVAAAAYAVAALRLLRGPAITLPVALLGIALGTLARVPLLALPDEVVARDTMRYVWDARVQRAGIDPYRVTPDDPTVAHVHSALTTQVDAAWLPTIYPPVAQLYFRGVTAISESLRAFRLAAMLSDALVALALAGILRTVGGSLAWALLYAWHPVMMFESATGGHLDFAGAALLAWSGLAFVTTRRAWGALLFAAAVLVKPLPIVLLPLVWKRARWREWVVAGLAGVASLIIVTGGAAPLGSMGAFVDHFRFNGPLFRLLAYASSPRAATALAVAAGLAVALRMRSADPHRVESWAWPMAAALVCAPVVYPWYFAWFVPFLMAPSAWPLQIWSLSIIAVYPVWQMRLDGGEFRVPAALLVAEFGAPIAVWWLWRTARWWRTRR